MGKKDNNNKNRRIQTRSSKRKLEETNSNNGKKKKRVTLIINDSDDDFIVSDDEEEYVDESSSSESSDVESSSDEEEEEIDLDDTSDEENELDNVLNQKIARKLKDQILQNVMRRAMEDEFYGEEDYEDDFQSKNKLENKKYFNKLKKSEQERFNKMEGEIKDLYKNIVPLRYKVLNMDTSISNKANILQKVDAFERMEDTNGEYTKLLRWVNGMKLLPLGKYKEIKVNKSHSKKKINKYLNNVYKILDKKLYGQYDAKNKLMQIIAQWISNPKSQTTVLALEGPPGVGKTSLIKHGLSKALDIPFSFIALGGSDDITTFTGHGYTYEGARCGCIVDTLIKSQCMNPIIFMDELDKMSKTEKGRDIIGLLTHLTDPTQNQSFVDKYYDGIEMDLSRVFFVFSFNDIKLIDPILKDRLNIIKFNGYNVKDKKHIVLKYIFPEILKNVGLNNGDIVLTDSNVEYIISRYTNGEKGVRNLKRHLEDIVMKINLIRFIKKDESKIHFPYDIKNINTKFPIKLANDMIDNLLKNIHKESIPVSIRHLYT